MQQRVIEKFNQKLFQNNEKYLRAWGKPKKLILPIWQAPMAGVGTYELAIAASNANCVGGLSCMMYNNSKIKEKVKIMKDHQKKDGYMLPFNINLNITEDYQAYKNTNKEHFTNVARFVEFLRQKRYDEDFDHSAVNLSVLPTRMDENWDAQFEAILEAKVPIFSTTFGALSANRVKMLQDQGTVVIGTATCVDEAIILMDTGVDGICLQGKEAGGHRGTFITKGKDQIDFMGKGFQPRKRLLSDVCAKLRSYAALKRVDMPMIMTAGGIISAEDIDEDLIGKKGLAHSDIKTQTADAVTIGTGFISTQECKRSHETYKLALRNLTSGLRKFRDPADFEIATTTGITGRPATGIRNRLMDEMEEFMTINKNSKNHVKYPLLSRLTGKIRRESGEQNDPEYSSLWAGTGVYKLREYSNDPSLPDFNCTTQEYVDRLVKHSKALSS